MPYTIPGRTIELTAGELDAAQDLADNGIEVRAHFTNWPGTPSTPARVLPHGDDNGNIEYETQTGVFVKLFAMPDELSVVPRAGLEVTTSRQLCRPWADSDDIDIRKPIAAIVAAAKRSR